MALLIELATQLIAGVASGDHFHPVRLRFDVFTRYHLDDITVFKRLIKGVDITIYLEAIGVFADIAMYAVGEVERQGAFG